MKRNELIKIDFKKLADVEYKIRLNCSKKMDQEYDSLPGSLFALQEFSTMDEVGEAMNYLQKKNSIGDTDLLTEAECLELWEQEEYF